jgi:hypothetical protein
MRTPSTKMLQFLKVFAVGHKKDLTCIIYCSYQSTGYFGEYNELAEAILG